MGTFILRLFSGKDNRFVGRYVRIIGQSAFNNGILCIFFQSCNKKDAFFTKCSEIFVITVAFIEGRGVSWDKLHIIKRVIFMFLKIEQLNKV